MLWYYARDGNIPTLKSSSVTQASGKSSNLRFLVSPVWVVSSDAYSLASTVMRRQAVFGMRNR
jgi:hypothetical protein